MLSETMHENPRYPFTQYPKGWYALAFSDEIRHGEVKGVEAFGQILAVYRGKDGSARVVNKCPHLGAALSLGKVIDNDIQCRFHGWQFDGSSGRCTKIPGLTVIPQKAKCDTYRVVEQDNHIYVWFARDNSEPSFELTPHPSGLNDPKWGKRLKFSWRIRMHPQEVAENLVDTEHFPIVHNYSKKPPLQFSHKDHWLLAEMDSRRHGRFSGPTPTKITYQGFGCTHASVKARPGVHMAVVLSTTPVADEYTRITIQAQVEKYRVPGLEAIVRQFVYKEIAEDFANDIPIWESKDYIESPLWSKVDGPIWKVRQWATQFY